MAKISDTEWKVMDVLWQGENQLGTIVDKLQPATSWSRNTVHTYLTRMEKKKLVTIDRTQEPHLYLPAVSREDCAKEERASILEKVYGGAAGDLIAAFLKETKISEEERSELRQLLDDMEV